MLKAYGPTTKANPNSFSMENLLLGFGQRERFWSHDVTKGWLLLKIFLWGNRQWSVV